MSSVYPLKSLGQNFLRQRKFLERIAQAVGKRNIVLEIGPGQGELTEFLSRQADELWAVEIDRRLFSFLKERFHKYRNIKLYNEDILKFNMRTKDRKITVVGNVPYYLSNDLIYYLVRQRQFINQAFLTFQYEFGYKLVAQGRFSSFLTFFLRYYAQTNSLFIIPSSAFFPSPKVKSLFVCIDFEKPYEKKCFCEEYLWQVIKIAFSQRRKKILNSLKSLAPARYIQDLLLHLGIPPEKRPESLTLDDFIKIAEALYTHR